MATRLVFGVWREIWQELAPLDGGAFQTITTDISCSLATLPKIDARLLLEAVTDNPLITGTLGLTARVG